MRLFEISLIAAIWFIDWIQFAERMFWRNEFQQLNQQQSIKPNCCSNSNVTNPASNQQIQLIKSGIHFISRILINE